MRSTYYRKTLAEARQLALDVAAVPPPVRFGLEVLEDGVGAAPALLHQGGDARRRHEPQPPGSFQWTRIGRSCS